jgi:hypothetical protein
MSFFKFFLKVISSLRFTVFILFAFMLITIVGTIFQVDNGINESKKIFFTSWLIFYKNFPVFPGGQLVLWAFFLNLLTATFTRFGFKLNKLGIWLAHLGLIILCFSSFYTYSLSEEAVIHFKEGETRSVADKDAWELAVILEDDNEKRVVAFSEHLLGSGRAYNLKDSFPELSKDVPLKVEHYYKNADVKQDFGIGSKYLSASEIVDLKELPENLKGNNVPGTILGISAGKKEEKIVLYGLEKSPVVFTVGKYELKFQLRRERLHLPFKLTLKDVSRDLYKGTKVAKNYESIVILDEDNIQREVRIYMNHPLSYDSFTVYQTSYMRDNNGNEYSTLTVVRNPVKYLPYIACIITALGMLLHYFVFPVFMKLSLMKRRKRGDHV